MGGQSVPPHAAQIHAPGDKLFVDYAGHTIPIIDRATGEVLFQAQIYTATMGSSNCTPMRRQRAPKTNTIGSVQMFGHWSSLEAMPRAIVPDNLKSGVTSAELYEPGRKPHVPGLCPPLLQAILPCRVRRPSG